MPRKKMKDDSCPCQCDRCELKTRSIPGTPHRRCGGSKGQKPVPKHSSAAGQRGKWVNA